MIKKHAYSLILVSVMVLTLTWTDSVIKTIDVEKGD
jgi:hypothetical protein